MARHFCSETEGPQYVDYLCSMAEAQEQPMTPEQMAADAMEGELRRQIADLQQTVRSLRRVHYAAARLLWHLCPVNTPVSFHDDWRRLHGALGGDDEINALNADRANGDDA